MKSSLLVDPEDHKDCLDWMGIGETGLNLVTFCKKLVECFGVVNLLTSLT